MSVLVTILDNGLRVATDTMADAESVVVGAWVGVGTRHEPWRANGLAHLVEHMMFKGTKNRSAYGLSSAIEKNGGMMNAHTTREETAYYARVLPEDTDLACDLIADMLQHSIFRSKELDREKQVIIQEIGRDIDSPEEHVFDLMHRIAFPKQKIGRSILGTAEVIGKLPRLAVLDYVKRHYHAGNMVIVGAGRIDHEAFVEIVRKHFGSLPKGRPSSWEKARIVSNGIYYAKDIEQLHVIIGFPGPSYHQKTIYAIQLLSILLGGSSSSRLFQKVREKRGLAYTVSAGHMPFSDTGMFQVYAGTDPDRVKELIPVICEELLDVTHNVSKPELARAKAQCRADLLMGKESVMRRAEVLGHQMLAFNKPIASEQTLERLMAITVDEIEAIATKLFSHRPIVAALGPIENLESYEKISKRLAA